MPFWAAACRTAGMPVLFHCLGAAGACGAGFAFGSAAFGAALGSALLAVDWHESGCGSVRCRRLRLKLDEWRLDLDHIPSSP